MSHGDEVAPGPLLLGRGWAEQGSSGVGDLILATRPHAPELGCSLSPPAGFYPTQCPPLGC